MKARLQYTGIRVRDLERSIRFYTQVLGLSVRDRVAFPETGGVVVDLVSEGSDHPIELNYYESASPFATAYEAGESLDHLSFTVPDLEAALKEAERAGFPVIEEVRTARSRWVYLNDPDGIWIELAERK